MLSVDFASTLDAYTKDKDDDVLRILIGLTSLGQINWKQDTAADDRTYYAFLGSGIYVTVERGHNDEPSLTMGCATPRYDSLLNATVIYYTWFAGKFVIIHNLSADEATTKKLLNDLIENVEMKLGLLLRRYVINTKLGENGQFRDYHATPREYVYHKPFTGNVQNLQYDHQKQTIYGDVLAEGSDVARDVVTDWKRHNLHLYEVKAYPYNNIRSTVSEVDCSKELEMAKSAEWVYPEDGAPYVIGRAFGFTGEEVLAEMLDFAKANMPKPASMNWVLEWALHKDTHELEFVDVCQKWDDIYDEESTGLEVTSYPGGYHYIIETTMHAYDEEHAKVLGRQMIADFFAIGKDIVSDNKEA